MKTLEEIKIGYLNGEEVLLEDEYLGEDGKVYCKQCNTSRTHVMPDNIHATKGRCACQQKAYLNTKVRNQREILWEDYYRRKRLAQVPERYVNSKLKDYLTTEDNKKAYKKVLDYLRNSEEMRNQNKGLYIYGDVGVGKTLIAACLCNELLTRGYSCKFTTITELLCELDKTYMYQGQVDGNVLKKVKAADFLFVDDFGKEFIGREEKPELYKTTEKQVNLIISARYHAKKPMIMTSNYSKNYLLETLKLDRAIMDKLNAMATVSVRISGKSYRIQEQMRLVGKQGV